MTSRVVFRKGTKVLLRPLEEEDSDAARAGLNDPEVTQFLARVFPLYQKEQRDFIAGLSGRSNDISLGIVQVESGKLIGSLGLHMINWVNRTAITGTVIWEKACWNKGYATEAKMLLLDLAFNALDLYVVQSRVFAPNGASLSYGKKCGYREVARIPQWGRMKDGTRADEVILTVTQEEWRPLWQKYLEEQKSKAG